MSFKRELFVSTRQVYPPLQDREQGAHTKIQGKLLRKLGDNAYPFFFEVRDKINLNCPQRKTTFWTHSVCLLFRAHSRQ